MVLALCTLFGLSCYLFVHVFLRLSCLPCAVSCLLIQVFLRLSCLPCAIYFALVSSPSVHMCLMLSRSLYVLYPRRCFFLLCLSHPTSWQHTVFDGKAWASANYAFSMQRCNTLRTTLSQAHSVFHCCKMPPENQQSALSLCFHKIITIYTCSKSPGFICAHVHSWYKHMHASVYTDSIDQAQHAEIVKTAGSGVVQCLSRSHKSPFL